MRSIPSLRINIFHYIVVLLRSVLVTPILPCISELRTGHRRLCHVRVCAAPGETFNILWYGLQIAHAALVMNVSMSAGSSELVMSISEVRIII